MWHHRLTRRQLLALAGTALTTRLGLPSGASAQRETARIGVVLPDRQASTLLRTDAHGVAGEAARRGAVMAEETVADGSSLELLISSAPNEAAALRAAQRLVNEGVFALVGGFGEEVARTLSRVAEEHEILFFNIGSSSDALRNEACNRYTFHVEASAAMYVAALAQWLAQSGLHRWFFVYAASEEGEAGYRQALETIHTWDSEADVVGIAVTANGPVFAEALEAIGRAKPDGVLLLLDWLPQLDFLGQYEAAGLNAAVTGFPEPVAQTREFFALSRNVAPQASRAPRVALWEATLDTYGARDLNERFISRWGEPMDPAAWAAYAAVKILGEAVIATGTTDPYVLVDYLESPDITFDIGKGPGISFRPWDHQLRQPLYIVRIDPEAAWGLQVSKRIGLAALVAEVPPEAGATSVERLDLLGDGPGESGCSLE